MAHIPVYTAEVKAGLSEKIRTNASVAYSASLELISAANIYKSLAEASAQPVLRGVATNEGQVDLHYLKSIMVTTGWNLNDDVFDIVESWIARFTPEDKPFNIEHDPHRIRGHITGNYVMDDTGNILPDSLSVDELPSKYHVVTSAVLYKFLKCPDPKLEEEMSTIIAEIKEGKWYVSMEAIFSNFDYAVVTADGHQHIIPRNEESAFLTKHLRAYGGDGQYANNKIGRLMRNIVFCGKGLVRKPANPESKIFANVGSFKATAKEFHQLQSSTGYKITSDNAKSKESQKMANENIQVELLEKQIKSLQDSMVAATKKNEEYEQRLKDLNEKQVKTQMTDLEGKVKASEDRVTALQAQVKTEQDARTAAETQVKQANEKLATFETELAKLKTEQTKAIRVSQWVERTGVDASTATKAVDKLIKLSDEEFKGFLETQPAKAVKTEDKKTDKQTTTTATEQVLKNADQEQSNGTVGGVDDTVEKTRDALSKFISGTFLRNKGKAAAAKEE